MPWVAIVGLAIAWATPVRAEEPHAPSSAPAAQPPETRWYGWQALLVDVPSVLLMGQLFSDQAAWGGAGAALFLVVPPVIHLVHGHPIKAIASLALRAAGVGTPLALGLYVAHRNCENGGDLCGTAGEIVMVETALFMIPAAFVVDDVAIARERVPPPMVPDAALVPWVAPASHGGWVVGVQGFRF